MRYKGIENVDLKYIIFEAKDTIAWITFNRPDTLNAVNPDVWRDLEKPAMALRAVKTAIHVGLRRLTRRASHGTGCFLYAVRNAGAKGRHGRLLRETKATF